MHTESGQPEDRSTATFPLSGTETNGTILQTKVSCGIRAFEDVDPETASWAGCEPQAMIIRDAPSNQKVLSMSMFLSVVLERGEVPESLSAGPGVEKSLANYFDDLHVTAQSLGLRPLGDFHVDYSEQLEAIMMNDDIEGEDIEEAMSRIGADGPWFDPDEGLLTVRGLIQHFESLSANEPHAVEGPLIVLRGIASELEHAKKHDDRFHLASHE